MKMSKTTVDDVLDYLRVDDPTENEKVEVENILSAAKGYILSYTGLEEEELDLYDEIWTALMVLCQDMYDNRARYVESGATKALRNSGNTTVEIILNMHRKNLL